MRVGGSLCTGWLKQCPRVRWARLGGRASVGRLKVFPVVRCEGEGEVTMVRWEGSHPLHGCIVLESEVGEVGWQPGHRVVEAISGGEVG